MELLTIVAISGLAAKPLGTVQDTVQKISDYFNNRYIATVGGFVCTLVTGLTQFSAEDLDVQTSAVNALSPAAPAFLADLWACINWVNTNSQYVEAEAAVGAKGGAPSNTSTPTFLAGGIEGTTLFAHYQAALNLLKKGSINTLVCLTPDPAVHAAADAHAAYMCGIGRNERDVVLGAMNAGMTDVPTKTEFKAQSALLNSRHCRLVGQAIERYNSAGEREEFMPYFTAAVIAGMQAGAEIGLPLTHKYANVLSLRSHNTWNPTDDSEEMIRGGCCFLENVEGIGRRVVRNNTTYLVDNNIAYCEASVNEAVNYSVGVFRTNMEYGVGRKGFSGTINGAKALAIGTLGLLVDETILVAYRSLDIGLLVDVMDVSIEMAPVIGINFVKNHVHLVTIRQSAAATR